MVLCMSCKLVLPIWNWHMVKSCVVGIVFISLGVGGSWDLGSIFGGVGLEDVVLVVFEDDGIVVFATINKSSSVLFWN